MTTARISIQADVANANAQIKRLDAQVSRLERTLERTGNAGRRAGQGLGAKGGAAGGGANLAGSAMIATGAVVGAYHAFERYTENVLEAQLQNKNLKISIDAAKDSTAGLVKEAHLVTAANRMTSLGLVATEAGFADVSETVLKLSQNVGVDFPAGMDALNSAMASGRTSALRQLGITLDRADAERIYAERIGKTRAEMTAAEKLTGVQTIAMERMKAVAEGLSLETESSAAGMQRFKTSIDDMIDDAYLIPSYLDEIGNSYRAVFIDMMGSQTPAEMEKAERAADRFFWTFFGGVEGARRGLRMLAQEVSGMGSMMDTVSAAARAAISHEDTQRAIQGQANAKAITGALAVGGRVLEQLNSEMVRIQEEKTASSNRRSSGRRSRRPQASRNDAVTAAVDIEEAGTAARVGRVNAEVEALERAAAIDQSRYALAAQRAGTDEEQAAVRLAALDAERIAQEQIFEMRSEAARVAGDRAEMEAIEHEVVMYRLDETGRRESELAALRKRHAAEENRRRMESMQRWSDWGQASSSVLGDVASTHAMAAQMAGVSDKQQQLSRMRLAGTIAIADATTAGVQSAIAFASGNIPQGVALAAAAAFGMARGGMLLSGRLPTGGGAGGGGGAVTAPTAPSGVGGTASRPGSRVPGSARADGRPAPAGGAASGGGASINVTIGQQVGELNDDAAEIIARALSRTGVVIHG